MRPRRGGLETHESCRQEDASSTLPVASKPGGKFQRAPCLLVCRLDVPFSCYRYRAKSLSVCQVVLSTLSSQSRQFVKVFSSRFSAPPEG